MATQVTGKIEEAKNPSHFAEGGSPSKSRSGTAAGC